MSKIDKNLKILIGIAIVFMIGIGIAGINTQSEIEKLTPAPVIRIAPIENKATLIINDGTDNSQTFQFKIKQEATVFDLLKQTGLSLDYTEHEMGIFIERIGDKKNGQDGKYWLYYVNEELPMIACDKKELKPGDKIEFRFEKSPF